MIDAGQVREIIKQYEKHGWTLRRVLLSDAKRRESLAASLENLFGGAAAVSFVSSEINALWFSRVSATGGEAWELRRLSGAPFALVKVFDANTNETEREQIRRETEKEMERGKSANFVSH